MEEQEVGRLLKQCCNVVVTKSHIFDCEKTQDYQDKLSMTVGVQRVYGLKSLQGDHYLWSDHTKRNRIFAQFPVSSFSIEEIMRCMAISFHGGKHVLS